MIFHVERFRQQFLTNQAQVPLTFPHQTPESQKFIEETQLTINTLPCYKMYFIYKSLTIVTNRYNKITVKILKNFVKSLLNTFFWKRSLETWSTSIWIQCYLKRDVRVNIKLTLILMSGVNLFSWVQLKYLVYEK